MSPFHHTFKVHTRPEPHGQKWIENSSRGILGGTFVHVMGGKVRYDAARSERLVNPNRCTGRHSRNHTLLLFSENMG